MMITIHIQFGHVMSVGSAAGDVTQKVPTFVWTSGESVTVAHGQNLTLECIAQAVPVPTITWTKYGGQLPAERHRVVFG